MAVQAYLGQRPDGDDHLTGTLFKAREVFRPDDLPGTYTGEMFLHVEYKHGPTDVFDRQAVVRVEPNNPGRPITITGKYASELVATNKPPELDIDATGKLVTGTTFQLQTEGGVPMDCKVTEIAAVHRHQTDDATLARRTVARGNGGRLVSSAMVQSHYHGVGDGRAAVSFQEVIVEYGSSSTTPTLRTARVYLDEGNGPLQENVGDAWSGKPFEAVYTLNDWTRPDLRRRGNVRKTDIVEITGRTRQSRSEGRDRQPHDLSRWYIYGPTRSSSAIVCGGHMDASTVPPEITGAGIPGDNKIRSVIAVMNEASSSVDELAEVLESKKVDRRAQAVVDAFGARRGFKAGDIAKMPGGDTSGSLAS